MKDYILNNVSMKDVLYRYGIKLNKDMFSCPFHKDRKPSAKAYENSFYCFSCNRHGDLIKFVEYYYNLSFKEAMQKINEDFNLGLDSNTKIDYNKINKIKLEREYKEKQKQKLMKEYCKLCDKLILLRKERRFIKNNISLINIDQMLNLESKFRNMQWEVEDEIENIEKRMATI